MNSAKASPGPPSSDQSCSGGTAYTISPGTCNADRLVTTITSDGAGCLHSGHRVAAWAGNVLAVVEHEDIRRHR